MNKLFDRIFWHNNTTPALNESNLNSMSKAIDDIDDRVIDIAGDVLETIPQLEEDLATAQELIEDLEGLNEHTPYIGANGNWWVWNTTTKEYEDSGVDASISVQIADITMLAPSATPYVTNSGTATDPIFHLFIPRGQGVSSVAKTSTSGLVDTYTMTFSDGSTFTYNVTNGADGEDGKTAYESAVDGGYTGTEAEFNAELADLPSYATNAAQSASNASASASAASGSATSASTSASDAEDSAEDSEAWAVGQRNGVDVPPTDPTYHNNAKYWSEQSAGQSLAGLEDVDIDQPIVGQALVYSSINKWANASLPSVPKMTTGVVAFAGDTSCTITDDAISSDSMIEVFTENISNTIIEPPTVSVLGHTATLTFEALTEYVIFYLRITNDVVRPSNIPPSTPVTTFAKTDYGQTGVTVVFDSGSYTDGITNVKYAYENSEQAEWKNYNSPSTYYSINNNTLNILKKVFAVANNVWWRVYFAENVYVTLFFNNGY